MINPTVMICNKSKKCNVFNNCGHKEPHTERDGCYISVGDLTCKGATCVPIQNQPQQVFKDREPYHRKKVDAHNAYKEVEE